MNVRLRTNNGDKASLVCSKGVGAAASALEVLVTTHAIDDGIDRAPVESCREIKIWTAVVKENDVCAAVLNELPVGGAATRVRRRRKETRRKHACKLQ